MPKKHTKIRGFSVHSNGSLKYHLVWHTKKRKKLLNTKEKRMRLRRYLDNVIDTARGELQECAIEIDHVHLLVSLPPSVSVSSIVQSLKGGSSKDLVSEFPGVTQDQLTLWGRGFWANTAGPPEDVTADYIAAQGLPL